MVLEHRDLVYSFEDRTINIYLSHQPVHRCFCSYIMVCIHVMHARAVGG